jgi:hypothetical protein
MSRGCPLHVTSTHLNRSLQRFRRGGAGIAGVSEAVKGANSIIIGFVRSQAGARKTLDIRPHGGDLGEGSVIRGAFDLEAILVRGGIIPGQIDLGAGRGCSGQAGGDRRNRGRRSHGDIDNRDCTIKGAIVDLKSECGRARPADRRREQSQNSFRRTPSPTFNA